MFDKTFAILLGASALALAATAPCHADEPGKGSTPAPALIHQGAVVQVPDNSPYRARIAVGVATQEAVAHEISVPGVVEADPAAIVNVLPPLAGRVVQLQVGLGDQVRAGQVLARLQSSDLLQAGSDAAKARDAYQLALAQRDRARSVHGEGGNAAKDLEAAESALVQARSELERAEQRLKGYGLPANADLDKLQLPITAPIAGTVQQLAAHTVGGVVTPAQTVMVVVPTGASPVRRKPTTGGSSRDRGWPSMAASASMPPTPQPSTPRPLTIVVCESVPTSVSQ